MFPDVISGLWLFEWYAWFFSESERESCGGDVGWEDVHVDGSA